MAIANTAHGGAATNTTTSSTSLAITVTAVAGEFIFVTISLVTGHTTSSVTDNIGNKYYFLNDQQGASGALSCWFCPKSSGTVATVTATHQACRSSGSVSTYTGVLGVGHCQETTNSANPNTVTMSPAIGAGNVMLAGMGDATGTQTWTAVTGTLRNNIAGGGSTTPGATNMDTLVSGGSTLSANLSSSVSGEAIAIELFSAALPLARDMGEQTTDMALPFMWSQGLLPIMRDIEREQEDWGWMPPVLPSAKNPDIYEHSRPMLSYFVPELETELEDIEPAPQTAAGLNLMGFRGFWSLKAAMDISSDMQPNYQVVGAPGANMMGFRGYVIHHAGMVPEQEFGFTPVAALPKMFYDADFNPTLMQEYYFNDDEVEKDNWGWKPPTQATAKQDDLWATRPQLQSYFFNDAEREAWEWGFDPTRYFSVRDEVYYESPARLQSYFLNVNDSTSELEAITEDFVHEMVSLDLMQSTPQQMVYWQWAEKEQIGLDSPFVDVDEQPDINAQQSVVDVESEQFGFQTAVVVTISAFDQDEGIYTLDFQQQWTDDDKTDSTFFAKEQYSDNDEQPIVKAWFGIQWVEDDKTDATFFAIEQFADLIEDPSVKAWLQYQQVDEDSFGFNVPEIEGELLLEEELQQPNQPYPITWSVEDEQWGKQAPFITSMPFDETIDQIGQPWWARDQVEDIQHGQNAPFLTAIAFDEEQFFVQVIARDDVEQFSFNTVFVQADDAGPLQAYPVVAEDELFGFQAATGAQAILPWDADYNPTMQQSYFFQSEDLEKYNWGWMPPMTKVAEDDAPYDAQSQLRSYFVPMLEDDTANWGWWKFFAIGDENIEQQRMQQSFYVQWQATDDDKTDSTFFAREQYGEGLEIHVPQQSFYFTEPETEMDNWGFNPSLPAMAFDQDENIVVTLQRLYHEEDFGFQQFHFYSDMGQDQNPLVLRQVVDTTDDPITEIEFADRVDAETYVQANSLYADDEQFGFKTPVFVATDDSGEQIISISRLTDDVEAFGFNPQLPTMDYTLPDEFIKEWRLYGEEEVWGYDSAFTDDKQDGPAIPPAGYDVDEFGASLVLEAFIEPVAEPPANQVNIQDEERQISFNVTQPFAFGDEIEHVPNPPYPVTHQTEFDQVGLNPPFIVSQPFAWEEAGVPPNPPWPLLDVTDYVDWITVINFPILHVYEISIVNLLMVLGIAIAQVQTIYELDTNGQFGVSLIESTACLTFSEIESVPQLAVSWVSGQ